jgi:SAM-dependent methyltransferase
MSVYSAVLARFRRTRSSKDAVSDDSRSTEPRAETTASDATPSESEPAPTPADHTLVRPGDVIERFTLEELSETADEYYRRIPDPSPLMAKPFASIHEAPEMLENLGRLLSGLRLGRTMTVLDFGAGTCWLSRIITELRCRAICVDTSATALAIGRRLFAEHPPLGGTLLAPQFLHFDGRRIALPDASVDRIICFDAFHHVPNQAEVLAELGRVLRPGGIAGFSEPGRNHSCQPQSQYEMRNHRVLENDIDLNGIFTRAQPAGFTALTVKLLNDSEVSLDDYNGVFDSSPPEALRARVWNDTHNTTFNRSIFFLHKGAPGLDSRGHEGLAHVLSTGQTEHTVASGDPLRISLELRNTGRARWLHENSEIYGIVRLGTHLFEADGRLVDIDHSRYFLPSSVAPGEVLAMTVDVPLPAGRTSVVVFDLVAEGVTWFENVGSTPLSVTVHAR